MCHLGHSTSAHPKNVSTNFSCDFRRDGGNLYMLNLNTIENRQNGTHIHSFIHSFNTCRFWCLRHTRIYFIRSFVRSNTNPHWIVSSADRKWLQIAIEIALWFRCSDTVTLTDISIILYSTSVTSFSINFSLEFLLAYKIRFDANMDFIFFLKSWIRIVFFSLFRFDLEFFFSFKMEYTSEISIESPFRNHCKRPNQYGWYSSDALFSTSCIQL